MSVKGPHLSNTRDEDGIYRLVATTEDVGDREWMDHETEGSPSEWRIFLEGPVAVGPAPGFRPLDFRNGRTGASVFGWADNKALLANTDDPNPYGQLLHEADVLSQETALRLWLLAVLVFVLRE